MRILGKFQCECGKEHTLFLDGNNVLEVQMKTLFKVTDYQAITLQSETIDNPEKAKRIINATVKSTPYLNHIKERWATVRKLGLKNLHELNEYENGLDHQENYSRDIKKDMNSVGTFKVSKSPRKKYRKYIYGTWVKLAKEYTKSKVSEPKLSITKFLKSKNISTHYSIKLRTAVYHITNNQFNKDMEKEMVKNGKIPNSSFTQIPIHDIPTKEIREAELIGSKP